MTVTNDIYNQVTKYNADGTVEQSSTATITPTSALAPYPDLHVAGLAVDPSSVLQSGGTIALDWSDSNVGDGAAAGNWYDYVNVVNTTTGQTLVSTNQGYSGQNIAAGDNTPRSYSFSMPNGAAGVGNLSVTVTADAGGSLPEYNSSGLLDTNRSANTTTTTTLADYPDLHATALAVDPSSVLQSGGTVTLDWSDSNVGDGAAAGSWSDYVNVVNSTTEQTLVSAVQGYSSQNIAAGGSAARSYSFTLPNGTLGIGQLSITVTADYYQNLPEYNSSGVIDTNRSANTTATATLANYPDLHVAGLAVDSSSVLRSGSTITLDWSDSNVGDAAAAGSWSDSIQVINMTTEQMLVSTAQSYVGNDIAAGGSTPRSYSFTLPQGAAGVGEMSITVTADADQNLPEYNPQGEIDTDRSANIAATTTLAFVDLVVTAVQPPDQLNAGDSGSLTWTVMNEGNTATTAAWHDAVFLSASGQIDSSAIFLTDVSEGDTPLAPDGSYQGSADFTIPAALSPGNYYLVIDVNYDRAQTQSTYADNTMAAAVAVLPSTIPTLEIVAQTPQYMLAAASETTINLAAEATDTSASATNTDDYSLQYVEKPIAQSWPTTDPSSWTTWTTWDGQISATTVGQNSWLNLSFPRQAGYDYAFQFTAQDSVGNQAQSSVVYCNEGYGTGDIIPVNLNNAVPAQDDPGASRQFTLQGIDFYDPSSDATTAMYPVAPPNSNRSDWILTYPQASNDAGSFQSPLDPDPQLAADGQPENRVAYVVFSDRTGNLPFSQTGQFDFAPPTVDGLPYDQLPDTSYDTRGYQGDIEVQFQVAFTIAPGQVDTRQYSTILRVNPGFSQTGDAAVQTGVDLTSTAGSVLAIMQAQQRLNYFGYPDENGNSLVVDGIIGPHTSNAIALFNAAAENKPSFSDTPTAPYNTVITSSLINDDHGPRWVQSGPSTGTAQLDSTNDWGTSWTNEVLAAAGENLADASDLSLVLNVGAISDVSGGNTANLADHQVGMQVNLPIGSTNPGSAPFYKTIASDGQTYVAAGVPGDLQGDSHVVYAISGTAAATTAGGAGASVQFSDSPDLSAVEPGSAWLWLAIPGGTPLVVPITAVDNVAKTITVGQAVSLPADSAVDYAIYYAGALPSVGDSAPGALTDPDGNGLSVGNDKEVLRGIAPLLVDNPAIGYDLADVEKELLAFANVQTPSGAKVASIYFNDPRTWNLPGISVQFSAGRSTYFEVNVAPPDPVAGVIQQLDQFSPQVFTTVANGLNLSTSIVPTIDGTLGSGLDLGNLLAKQFRIPDIAPGTSMASIASALTAGGFQVDHYYSETQLDQIDLSQPLDFIDFSATTSFTDLTGSMGFNAQQLNAISALVGIPFTGSPSIQNANLDVTLSFGVDQTGFFLDPGRITTGDFTIGGPVQGPLGTQGSASGTTNVTLNVTEDLPGASADDRYRLQDLLATNLVLFTNDLIGVARTSLGFQLDAVMCNTVAFTGQWVWNIDADGATPFTTAGAVLDPSQSGIDDNSYIRSLFGMIGEVVNAIGGKVNAFSDSVGAIPYVGSSLEEQLTSAISDELNYTDGSDITATFLNGQGYNFNVDATPEQLIQDAVNDTPAQGDLITVEYTPENDQTLTVNASGSASFGSGGAAAQIDASGTLQGPSDVSGDMTLGVDTLGGPYVVVGSYLDYDLTLESPQGSPLTGSVNLANLVNVTATADADIEYHPSLTIDDGSNIPDQRIYFCEGSSLADDVQWNFTNGSLALNNLVITGSLPVLGNLLPPLVINGSASYDLATGASNVQVSTDAMTDAFASLIATEINGFGSEADVLAGMVEHIPAIGQGLSGALGAAIADPLNAVQVPETGATAYLESRGFTVLNVISWDDLAAWNLSEPALLLQYAPPATTASAIGFSTNQGLTIGPVDLALTGNLSVSPTVNFNITFGLDLAQGPFIDDGGTIGLSLPVSGMLSGAAYIGNLNAVNATATLPSSTDLGATLTLSSSNPPAGGRYYLGGTGDSALDLSSFVDNPQAVALTGSLDVDLGLTVANPAAQIPLIGPFLPSNISWNAVVGCDLASGTTPTYTVQQDSAFQQLVQLFTGSEDSVEQAFFGYVNKYDPLPQSLRTLLTTPLPLVDQSLIDLLGAPSSVDILLNPTGYEQDHSPGPIDENDNGDDVTLNFEFLDPSNIMALLSGQTANLVSLSVDQSFSAPTEPITVLPDTPFFSFLGVVNITGNVEVTPIFSFGTDVKMGFDTNGFYVAASNGANAVSVSAGLTLSINVDGRLVVVPLAQVTGSATLSVTAGLQLVSPSGDGKLRADQVLDPNNITVGLSAAITLGLSAEIGFIGTPFVDTDLPSGQKVIPLFNDNSTSFAGITQQFDDYKNELSQDGNQLASAFKGYLIAGPWGAVIGYEAPAIAAGAHAVENYVSTQAQDAEAAANHAGGVAAQYYHEGLDAVNNALNSFDQNVLEPIGKGLTHLGDVIANVLGFDGWTSVTPSPQYDFDAQQQGSTLTVTWTAAGPANLTIDEEDGELFVVGPTFVQNCVVAERYDVWSQSEKYKTQNVTFLDQQTFDPTKIDEIVVAGTLLDDDSVIVTHNVLINASLTGGNGNDLLVGGGGNNTLIAGDGNDTLVGGSGNNLLNAGNGNDVLTGGSGSNTLTAGDGNDLLTVQDAGSQTQNYLTAGNGNDTLVGSAGTDYMYSGTGQDFLQGGSGTSFISAGPSGVPSAGPDTVDAGSGQATIWAGVGDDYISADQAAAELYGGTGNDTLVGGSAPSTLYGGVGTDALLGGSGDVTMYAGAGADYMMGGSGNSVMYGGNDGDLNDPGSGNDIIIGGSGPTTIYGGVGGPGYPVNPNEAGSDFNILEAGDGPTTIFGGGGSELYHRRRRQRRSLGRWGRQHHRRRKRAGHNRRRQCQ